MLKLLAVATVGAAWLGAEVAPSVDPGTMLLSYGVAAPFAGLCFWMLLKANKDSAEKDRKIDALQKDAIDRERDFVFRLAPLLHDGALLYQKGNERLTATVTTEDEIHALKESVDGLIRRLGNEQ